MVSGAGRGVVTFFDWVLGESQLFTIFSRKVDVIMATLQDLQQKLAELGQTIVAEKAEVQGALTDLKAQIATLQGQIASGTLVTAADLDNLVAAVDAIVVGVKDISEPTA